MALISKPYTFSVGATIVASEHNSNFDTLYSDYNGNITNSNISGSAAISDSKLAQITSASKVSGAALTSLSSIPGGAGLIPVANIDTGTAGNKIVLLSGGTTGKLPAVDASQLTNFLGAWASKSENTVYQATTDGFFMGFVSTTGTLTIYTDSSNPPTTARATDSSTTGNAMCVFSPVRKNDYYKGVSGGIAATWFFIPLGS